MSHLLPELTPEMAAAALRRVFELSVFPPHRLFPAGGSKALTEYIEPDQVDEAIAQVFFHALPAMRVENLELS